MMVTSSYAGEILRHSDGETPNVRHPGAPSAVAGPTS
jgi:hypothetical protein